MKKINSIRYTSLFAVVLRHSHNLEKHDIAWANWDYKGGFGIAVQASRPDEEMIRALIPK